MHESEPFHRKDAGGPPGRAVAGRTRPQRLRWRCQQALVHAAGRARNGTGGRDNEMSRQVEEDRARADAKTGKTGALVLWRTQHFLLPIEELARAAGLHIGLVEEL